MIFLLILGWLSTDFWLTMWLLERRDGSPCGSTCGTEVQP